MRRILRFILDMDARAWRTVAVSFALFGGVGLLFVLATSAFGFKGEATVQSWLGFAAQSPYALLIAVAAFAVLAFAGVPQIVLIAAATVAFGPWLGSLYSWVGTLVSAAIGFWLGRLLGARALERFGGKPLHRFIALVGRNGFWASMIIRMVPSAPFAVLNMAAGVTPMRFSAFTAGTAVGVAPKIGLIVLAGHWVVHARGGKLWLNLVLLALALVVWIGAGLWARKWINSHEAEAEVANAADLAPEPLDR
jgi:uncharacterized membrane protein YdjX (TVP38/TMEM64 family)